MRTRANDLIGTQITVFEHFIGLEDHAGHLPYLTGPFRTDIVLLEGLSPQTLLYDVLKTYAGWSTPLQPTGYVLPQRRMARVKFSKKALCNHWGTGAKNFRKGWMTWACPD